MLGTVWIDSAAKVKKARVFPSGGVCDYLVKEVL